MKKVLITVIAGRAVSGLSMGGGHVWANWRSYLTSFVQGLFK